MSRIYRVTGPPGNPFPYRRIKGKLAHRVIAEQMLGRPLLAQEVVHHIDGDPMNNDPCVPVAFQKGRWGAPFAPVDGCEQPINAQGLCNRHYKQMRKGVMP